MKIRIAATNITSPLGLTTQENFCAVREGRSALKTLRDYKGIPGQICAGVFSDNEKEALMISDRSWFESLAIRSIREAISRTGIDITSERTGFILSTTKGNVDGLGASESDDDLYCAPGEAAERIAQSLGIRTQPFTICNACISGVTAQIFAERLINAGKYDDVIVCGADTVSDFCLAGFLSFKALSPLPCRPFDIERLGLNLGECAATVILSRAGKTCGGPGEWRIASSGLDNDAFHVSAPSPTGEGLVRIIRSTLGSTAASTLATVCAHGTATMFNDQSESLAIASTGLGDIPISSCKSYFGHTLGAAGVLEPILTMQALDEEIILPVKGFEEIGVSGKIKVCDKITQTDKKSFLKLISGFGGCNGAILYTKDDIEDCPVHGKNEYRIVNSVRIVPDSENSGPALLTETYKNSIDDNPRFYKMDIFSRLAYVATGLLVKNNMDGHDPESVGMVLFNRSSSVLADRQHLGTYRKSDDFYPSPSVFINTLPNVVMGETAVKYGIKGETSFVILPDKDDKLIEEITDSALQNSSAEYLIAGWVNADSENIFEADLKLYKRYGRID